MMIRTVKTIRETLERIEETLTEIRDTLKNIEDDTTEFDSLFTNTEDYEPDPYENKGDGIVTSQ